MKTAIVIGSQGQDGKLLQELLFKNNYTVFSIDINYFKVNNKLTLKPIDITKYDDVENIIKENLPDEIYYLAAFHHSSEDNKIDELSLLHESYKINVLALNYFLYSIKEFSPKTKLFYAASSLIFGDTNLKIQNENTPYGPNTIYGITKLDGLLLCRYYKKIYNIFACVGIFYNHESEYRTENFLSKKIISKAVKIKKGELNKLTIGNINTVIDWGYAPDYIKAAFKMMKLSKPYELIVATGKKHTVKYFIETTFRLLNINWKNHVEEEPMLLTRKTGNLVGNASKLIKLTNWKQSVTFEEMIKILLIKEGAVLNE